MKTTHLVVAAAAGALLIGGSAATAGGGGGGGDDDTMRTKLQSFEDVPAVSSTGQGASRPSSRTGSCVTG